MGGRAGDRRPWRTTSVGKSEGLACLNQIVRVIKARTEPRSSELWKKIANFSQSSLGRGSIVPTEQRPCCSARLSSPPCQLRAAAVARRPAALAALARRAQPPPCAAAARARARAHESCTSTSSTLSPLGPSAALPAACPRPRWRRSTCSPRPRRTRAARAAPRGAAAAARAPLRAFELVILLVVSTSSAAAAALRRPGRAALRGTARTRAQARCSQSSPASIGAAIRVAAVIFFYCAQRLRPAAGRARRGACAVRRARGGGGGGGGGGKVDAGGALWRRLLSSVN